MTHDVEDDGNDEMSGSARPTRTSDLRRPVVAVGEFDGFHLGHRDLIARAATVATNLGRPLLVVVLDSVSRGEVLTPVEARVRRVIALGPSRCEALQINDLAADNARVATEVIDRCDPAVVVLACSIDRADVDLAVRDASMLAAFTDRGVEVVRVERRFDRGGAVTSDRIRSALEQGDMTAVLDVAGEPYEIAGEVVHGAQLGRTIGFPTANVLPPLRRRLPCSGVFAGAVVTDDGAMWDAALNLGTRPSVDNSGQLLLEAHLIGFDGDLYGRRIRVSFIQKLRDERRFESLDELTAQLHLDVEAARLLQPTDVLRGRRHR